MKSTLSELQFMILTSFLISKALVKALNQRMTLYNTHVMLDLLTFIDIEHFRKTNYLAHLPST